jgi:electron transfer flavoprotein alpha subunit
MIAVVPVREGVLPLGALEAVAECDGRVIVAGSGTGAAADAMHGVATVISCWETSSFAPARWARALATVLGSEPVVVLPASPDGRDLAPRLARALGRPLLAGAVSVTRRGASLSRWGGLVLEDVDVERPFVATLTPGVRGVTAASTLATPTVTVIDPEDTHAERDPSAPTLRDPVTTAVLPPDAATMDLAEAPRIVAGGAGLAGPGSIATLAAVAAGLGASLGATRVVTDRGWLSHERQIGTTGVVVSPRLYLAFAISGAVQHTSGIGHPDHVISVNTDPSCPMMQLADLAIVADADAVVTELAGRLGLATPDAP